MRGYFQKGRKFLTLMASVAVHVHFVHIHSLPFSPIQKVHFSCFLGSCFLGGRGGGRSIATTPPLYECAHTHHMHTMGSKEVFRGWVISGYFFAAELCNQCSANTHTHHIRGAAMIGAFMHRYPLFHTHASHLNAIPVNPKSFFSHFSAHASEFVSLPPQGWRRLLLLFLPFLPTHPHPKKKKLRGK